MKRLKVGDKVEILEHNCSKLEVGSQGVITEKTGRVEKGCYVWIIDGWLFTTRMLKKVGEAHK